MVAHVHQVGACPEIEQPVQMVPVPALEDLAVAQHPLGALNGTDLPRTFVTSVTPVTSGTGVAGMRRHKRDGRDGRDGRDARDARSRWPHLDVDERRVLSVDLEQRQVRVEEEARLARAADGEVEVLQPVVAKEELADDLRVVVERICEQEDLEDAFDALHTLHTLHALHRL